MATSSGPCGCSHLHQIIAGDYLWLRMYMPEDMSGKIATGQRQFNQISAEHGAGGVPAPSPAVIGLTPITPDPPILSRFGLADGVGSAYLSRNLVQGSPKGKGEMSDRNPEELLTPSEAAHILSLSADTVRSLSDKGLLPTLRTMSGRRLFRRGDVERLAKERLRKGQPSQQAEDV
jgi:excisionase family DNA binding protein